MPPIFHNSTAADSSTNTAAPSDKYGSGDMLISLLSNFNIKLLWKPLNFLLNIMSKIMGFFGAF